MNAFPRTSTSPSFKRTSRSAVQLKNAFSPIDVSDCGAANVETRVLAKQKSPSTSTVSGSSTSCKQAKCPNAFFAIARHPSSTR